MKDLYDFIIYLIENLNLRNRARRLLTIIIVVVFIAAFTVIFFVRLIEKRRNRFLPHRQRLFDRINYTNGLFLECETIIHNRNRAGETIRYLRNIDESIGKIYIYYRNHSNQLQNYALLVRDLNQKRIDLDTKWIYLCETNAFISAGSPSGKSERNWDALDVTKPELTALFDKTQASLTALRKAVADDIPLECQSHTVQNKEDEES